MTIKIGPEKRSDGFSLITMSAPRIEVTAATLEHDLDDSEIEATRSALLAEIDASIATAAPGASRVPQLESIRSRALSLRTKLEATADGYLAARELLNSGSEYDLDKLVNLLDGRGAYGLGSDDHVAKLRLALADESFAAEVRARCDEVTAKFRAIKTKREAERAAEDARYAAQDDVERKAIAERKAVSAVLLQLQLALALSPEQTRRNAAGLLPDKERNEALGGLFFEPFIALNLYERMDNSTGAHGDECMDGQYTFSSSRATECSDKEFAALEEVKSLAPADATVELRLHLGECECGATVERRGIRVTIDRGIELSREYEV